MTVHQPLWKVLREVPGKWVAVDRRTNELKAVSDTPYDLAARIRQNGLTNVAIIRAPAAGESELVGFG